MLYIWNSKTLASFLSWAGQFEFYLVTNWRRKFLLLHGLFEPHHEKTCSCHMGTTKTQISLHIRAVRSVPLFSLYKYYNTYTCLIQSLKTLASLPSWAGRFESHLVATPQRQVFSWRGSFVFFRISVRAGSQFHDLVELEQIELSEPVGWVRIPLKDTSDKPIRTFMIQIAILSNHQNGRDTHVRRIKIRSPVQNNPLLKFPKFTSHEFNMKAHIRWALSWENLSYAICEQRRCRSACASAQSDQCLCCSLPRQYNIYAC